MKTHIRTMPLIVYLKCHYAQRILLPMLFPLRKLRTLEYHIKHTIDSKRASANDTADDSSEDRIRNENAMIGSKTNPPRNSPRKAVVLLFWCMLTLVASAFSGASIAPVVVNVVDAEGRSIEGAIVKITGSRLEEIPKHETDPKSEFAELARKAAREAKTDMLGMCLVYCAGGWMPAKEGVMAGLSGNVEVKANGFQSAIVPFRRSIASEPEGGTELVLKVTVVLQKASREDAGKK